MRFPLFSILLACTTSMAAQDGSDRLSGFKSYIIVNEGYDLDQKRFSYPGLGYELQHLTTDRLSLQLRIEMTHWANGGRYVFPLTLGPAIHIGKSASWRPSLITKAGPTLLIGNDYAGIFGHMEAGLRLTHQRRNDRLLSIELSFVESMAWHPDHFQYLKLSLGVGI